MKAELEFAVSVEPDEATEEADELEAELKSASLAELLCAPAAAAEARVPLVLKMGRWSSPEPLPTVAPPFPKLASGGDLRPASRKRLAFSGLDRRHSLSRRDLWRDSESLEISPNRPKKNSKAISILRVFF